MSPLLEVRDLVVRRGKQVVLRVPHLQVEKGEVLALVGPNGSGKTTLMLVMARLLKPVQGSILFEGQPINEIADLEYRRRISMVMQDLLLLNLSVMDNVSLGLRFRGMPHAEVVRRADEWLERLSITHLRNRRATSLSGGEAQRVSLARALVLQPKLILMDEPFQSLDESSHAALIADLKNILPTTDTTVVFSTHSQKDVRELSQRRVSLTNGNLSQVEPGHAD